MSVREDNTSPWAHRPRKRGRKFPMKQDAVINAAATLMRRKGYEGSSLSELAEILGITKPTLYYYVSSKEELYAQIVARSQTETLDAMKRAVEQTGSGYERLRALMLGYVELINSDLGACLMIAGPYEMDRDLWRQIQTRTREGNDLIYSVLADGMKDGSLNISDPTVALHTLFGSLNWIPRWFRPTGRLSLREIAEGQVRTLLEGVRGPMAPTEDARESRRRR